MAKLKGTQVILIDKVKIEEDQFNKPIYDDKEIYVENVLIAPTSTDEVLTTQNLTGRTSVYTLAIPKGDKNDWENKEVIFFGKRWRVFGATLEGIETMIPLQWNKKVMVERYE